MNPTYNRHILPGHATAVMAALLMALLAFAMQGCSSQEDMPGPGPGDGAVYRAGFYLVMSQEEMTRTPEGDYDPGAREENFVDFAGGDYRVLFFDADDTYAGTLSDITYSVADNALYRTYFVEGEIDREIAEGKSLKAMIIANWGKDNYPAMTVGATKIADMANNSVRAFDATPEGDLRIDGIDGRRHIPMFGVTNLRENITFDINHYYNMGPLHLLRAYAKVEVEIGTLNEQFKIESVRLTHVNDKCRMAPSGVTCQDNYVKGNYAEDYVDLTSIPDGTVAQKDIPFVKTSDGHYVLYVPEFMNVEGGDGKKPFSEDKRARIEVRFSGSHYDSQFIDFKYYNDPPKLAVNQNKKPEKGDHFDIRRNNWYSFTISKDQEVIIEVDVLPYTGVELDPDFGILHNEISRSRKKSPAD